MIGYMLKMKTRFFTMSFLHFVAAILLMSIVETFGIKIALSSSLSRYMYNEWVFKSHSISFCSKLVSSLKFAVVVPVLPIKINHATKNLWWDSKRIYWWWPIVIQSFKILYLHYRNVGISNLNLNLNLNLFYKCRGSSSDTTDIKINPYYLIGYIFYIYIYFLYWSFSS